jgi:hypothetical protein
MKNMVMLGLAVAALGWSAVAASAGTPACGCCADQCCTVQKPVFHVEVAEKKCTVPVKVDNPYLIKARVIEKDVPFCRQVPVCVTDPCTGCTHTEFKEEKGVEKVKVKVYDIIPPEVDCTTKMQDKITRCATVTWEYLTVAVPPPPCAPTPCCAH